eukprot:jgi/Mesen1/4030/ME000212S03055
MAEDQGEEDGSAQAMFYKPAERRPWHAPLVLFAAVCAISSAGAVMKSMGKAAPITRAGWRLQVTALVQLPGFVWQWIGADEALRRRCFLPSTLLLLAGSTVALALHFGLWVYSLDTTSLPHSLLFVTTPPLIFVALALCGGEKLASGEIGGTLLGAAGTAIMVLGHATGGHSEHDVSVVGDVAAFLAAASFVGYLSAGRRLREWMPLYIYVMPITAGAATLLAFAGLVGHTGLNAVLRYMPPLLIAVAITAEPPLGSAIGWALHVSGAPGLWTLTGGAVLLTATLWVNYASHQRQLAEAPIAVHHVEDREMAHFTLESSSDEEDGRFSPARRSSEDHSLVAYPSPEQTLLARPYATAAQFYMPSLSTGNK